MIDLKDEKSFKFSQRKHLKGLDEINEEECQSSLTNNSLNSLDALEIIKIKPINLSEDTIKKHSLKEEKSTKEFLERYIQKNNSSNNISQVGSNLKDFIRKEDSLDSDGKNSNIFQRKRTKTTIIVSTIELSKDEIDEWSTPIENEFSYFTSFINSDKKNKPNFDFVFDLTESEEDEIIDI